MMGFGDLAWRYGKSDDRQTQMENRWFRAGVAGKDACAVERAIVVMEIGDGHDLQRLEALK